MIGDWFTNELRPRHTSSVTVRPRTSVVVKDRIFQAGDVLKAVVSGTVLFATDDGTKNSDGWEYRLDTRWTSLVTLRKIGERIEMSEDGYEIVVDITEPLAIPHWQVHNMQPDEMVVNVGKAYKG